MKIISKCRGCGECCRNPWRIILNVEDIKKITKLGYPIDNFVVVKTGNAEFKRKQDLSCVFLGKDNLCLIHKKHGYQYKANTCKKFPVNELVCGEIKSIQKFKKPEKLRIADSFFHINRKYIYHKTFANLMNRLDENLFDSYCNILFNIFSQKEEIIINKINTKNYPLNLSKLRNYIEKMFFYELSYNPFPKLNKFTGNEITIDLNISGQKKFSFKMEKTSIPKKVIRSFIPYLKEHIGYYNSIIDYPLKLIIILYYLPFFAKTLAEDKEITLKHLLKAFSLLNGLNRFCGLILLKYYTLSRMEKQFDSLIRPIEAKTSFIRRLFGL